MPDEKPEILDKDEFASVPPLRKSGLTSMAEKLEKLLSGDDAPAIPAGGSEEKPDPGTSKTAVS